MTTIHVLLLSPIDSSAIAKLRERHSCILGYNISESDQLKLLRSSDVIVVRSGVQLSAQKLRLATRLRLLIRAGSGTDNIDTEYLNLRGIPLVTIPEASARAVAELTFALILATARNIVAADRSVRQGCLDKHQLSGRCLYGAKLGVIGVGRIGSLVGNMGTKWGMEVIGCVRHATSEARDHLRELSITMTTLDDLLSTSDFVSIHVPLNRSSRHLINENNVWKMKRGAFLVNTSRASIVDECALKRALASGHIAGLGLDVHALEAEGKDSGLAELPNVVLTPHIGAETKETQAIIGERIVKYIEQLAGKG